MKALILAGDREAAREKFSDLVATQQRRAVRPYESTDQERFWRVLGHVAQPRWDLLQHNLHV